MSIVLRPGLKSLRGQVLAWWQDSTWWGPVTSLTSPHTLLQSQRPLRLLEPIRHASNLCLGCPPSLGHFSPDFHTVCFLSKDQFLSELSLDSPILDSIFLSPLHYPTPFQNHLSCSAFPCASNPLLASYVISWYNFFIIVSVKIGQVCCDNKHLEISVTFFKKLISHSCHSLRDLGWPARSLSEVVSVSTTGGRGKALGAPHQLFNALTQKWCISSHDSRTRTDRWFQPATRRPGSKVQPSTRNGENWNYLES